MKTIITILLLVTSTQVVFSQLPIIKWDKSYGGSQDEDLRQLIPTQAGGFILGGRSSSGISGDKTQANLGGMDYWVVKVDGKGNKVWDKTIGGSGEEVFNSVVETGDGGYLLGGFSSSGISGDKTQASRGQADYWVVRLDSSGNKIWDKRYGGSAEDRLARIITTPDGGYLLVGQSISGLSGDKSQSSRGNWDYWVVKIDSLGDKQWDKALGGDSYDDVRAVVRTYDGGFLLGGMSRSGISGEKSQARRATCTDCNDYWVVKIDSLGNKLWDKTYGGTGSDALFAIVEVETRGFLLGGVSGSSESGEKTEESRGGDDYWLVMIDSLGNKLWDKTLGGNQYDHSNTILPVGTGYLIGGTSLSGISGEKTEESRGSSDYWIVMVDSLGNKQWDKTIGGNQEDGGIHMAVDSNGEYLLAGFSASGISGEKTQNSKGGKDFWAVKLTKEALHNTIEGFVSQNLTDCENGTLQSGVLVHSTDNQYRTVSRPDGSYTLYVFDTLAHTFTVDPPRYFTASCDILEYQFTEFEQTLNHDFVLRQDTACVLLEVDLAAPFHRRCFDNNKYKVSYRNMGTETATDAYVHVRLDPLLSPISSSIPWRTPQVGDDLYFDLGNLAPDESGSFSITYLVSCEAMWEQLICSRAHIYPDTSCWRVNPDGTPAEPGAPDNTVWDKSSVSVTGYCRNDSTHFVITNTGEPSGGDMLGTSEYRVFVDNGLALTGSFQLAGGQSQTYSYLAAGHSLRFEADQRPGHPGFSRPREAMSCGSFLSKTSVLFPGSILPDNDDLFAETDCQQVIGSYDPNDKGVMPSGISKKNYVLENTLMSYKIRFQNTGNDTAFTVVVRDTLSPHLDMSTLMLGQASHPFEFYSRGQELVWTFNDIRLVDSTTNEPESHGYIKFKIRQNTDLPRGTRISNLAGIYFDFNDPIITNDAWITVGDTTLDSPINLWQQTSRLGSLAPDFKVYPNPATDVFTVKTSMPGTYTLRLLNIYGQVVHTSSFVGSSHIHSTRGLARGVYSVQLQGTQGQTVQRLVVQ